MPAEVPVDLHGYHPDDISGSPLRQMIKQAWEMGAEAFGLFTATVTIEVSRQVL
jgi:hypothetical protein